MNKILIAVILGCYLAIVAESFLGFGHKYKDGCDPNPCKNYAKCVLTEPNKNKNKSRCDCDDDHFGTHCEHKFGCPKKKNPCGKHGDCMNNPLNKTDYICKCQAGYVGKDCDKKNACESKNPCKNGKCLIEKKSGDHYCECNAGFGGKSCDKHECNITEFKLKQHTKKSAKLWINKEIEEKVKSVDDLAKLCKVRLHVMKSFVLHPDKTKAHMHDSKDKTNANFYTGHAIGLHLYDTNDKLLCNDVCMAKVPCPVPEAKCFLDGLYAIKWKWSVLDSGVIHTNNHIENLSKYNHKRESCQRGCADKKFS